MRKYDTINGVKVEVPKQWFDFSKEELETICNGVGAEDSPIWLKRLLSILPYLYRASRPHDVMYMIGGSSKDRLKADRMFKRNCYRVARKRLGGFWKCLFNPVKHVKWLFALTEIRAAYRALRLFGRSAFNENEMEDPAIERKV